MNSVPITGNERKSHGSSWYEKLEQVLKFIEQYKRFPIKNGTSDEYELRLAYWRHHNTSLFNRGLLSEGRADYFVDAGLNVELDNSTWNTMLKRTKLFVHNYGRLPSRHGATNEERITGRWRTDQNSLLKSNKLTEKRTNLFVDAGLTGNILDDKWRQTLKDVVRFRKEFGHLPRASGCTVEESRLGFWCSANRHIMNKQYPKEKSGRKVLINAASINDRKLLWNRWDVKYKRMLNFCEQHNRLPAHGSVEEEFLNYQWYVGQLVKVDKKLLDKEQSEKIISIKNRYAPAKLSDSAKWNNRYSRIFLFIERNNRLPNHTEKDTVEGRLAIWLQSQRMLIPKGKLSEKEMMRLSKLHQSMKDVFLWSRSGVDKNNDAKK